MTTKNVRFSFSNITKHWVGNGFNVHGLLQPSNELNKYLSPFLMMDYASPIYFSKTKLRRGVGEHPHRGFETVTFAYQGEIEHRDSSGGGGLIKPGDIQWMTAGSGIVHDEYHSKKFSKKGGLFEMVQLWINLPSKFKMVKPKYQSLEDNSIPRKSIGMNSELRVIAGNFENTKGPALTFTNINIYDLISKKKDNISILTKQKTNSLLLIMSGEVEINNKLYKDKTLLVFEKEGKNINFSSSKEFKGLILNGEPINEAIYSYGPFVMNTKKEIEEAMDDYNNGRMGNI